MLAGAWMTASHRRPLLRRGRRRACAARHRTPRADQPVTRSRAAPARPAGAAARRVRFGGRSGLRRGRRQRPAGHAEDHETERGPVSTHRLAHALPVDARPGPAYAPAGEVMGLFGQVPHRKRSTTRQKHPRHTTHLARRQICPAPHSAVGGIGRLSSTGVVEGSPRTPWQLQRVPRART